MTNGYLGAMGRIVKVLRTVFVVGSGLSLLGLVGMITADSFFRYVFSKPFPASLEISQLVQPYVVFLPFAYALATGSHVRVTLLTQKVRGLWRRAVESLPYLVGFVFFTILTYVSWLNFWESFRINETMLAAIRLYWWIGKLAMPLGSGAITLECLYQFLLAVNVPAARAEVAG